MQIEAGEKAPPSEITMKLTLAVDSKLDVGSARPADACYDRGTVPLLGRKKCALARRGGGDLDQYCH